MPTVTVRGRINTIHLREGEVATVERTDRLDRLIRAGYLEIITREEGQG